MGFDKVTSACVACALVCACPVARAQTVPAPQEAKPSWSTALFVEVAVAFVPVANDVPTMLGLGARFADVHELWARVGYIPTGDDVRLGFGVVGYRVALRPHKLVRPLFGGLVAALPETCTHDASGRPTCASTPLFIFAGTVGVRIEPTPWLGLSSILTLGVDSYPNPFGMIELALSFAWPLS